MLSRFLCQNRHQLAYLLPSLLPLLFIGDINDIILEESRARLYAHHDVKAFDIFRDIDRGRPLCGFTGTG